MANVCFMDIDEQFFEQSLPLIKALGVKIDTACRIGGIYRVLFYHPDLSGHVRMMFNRTENMKSLQVTLEQCNER